ncbi:hypothetical protein [Dyadobacter sp. MSC1_007]|uniref:hypothetical protein n=1 Tax=Dyadobacter sp. MSC1_007 TaxID=2909264 RepID=UPI00202E4FC0|nr:hypothetical protein [Dyadobacter sp. MSC1_007]
MEYPYEFVDEKFELVGNHRNKMELYAYSGNIDLELLKHFCFDKKKNFDGYFYHIVLFDTKSNALFPLRNPFTAAYSDEETVKNIRAMYIHNTVNEYSKMKIYQSDKSEYPVLEFDV